MRFYQSSGGEHGPPRLLATALVVAVCFLASSARANSVELGALTITGAVGGPYTWSYDVNLTGHNYVSNNAAGDTIGLFDIGGYVPGSFNFAPTALLIVDAGNYAKISDTDAALSYQDDPPAGPGPELYITGGPPGFLQGGADLALPDLYFDYVGGTHLNGTNSTQKIGTLSYISTTNLGATDLVFTTDTPELANPPGRGAWQEVVVARNGGFVVGPTPTASLGGVALFAILAGLRLRRRDEAEVA